MRECGGEINGIFRPKPCSLVGTLPEQAYIVKLRPHDTKITASNGFTVVSDSLDLVTVIRPILH